MTVVSEVFGILALKSVTVSNSTFSPRLVYADSRTRISFLFYADLSSWRCMRYTIYKSIRCHSGRWACSCGDACLHHVD